MKTRVQQKISFLSVFTRSLKKRTFTWLPNNYVSLSTVKYWARTTRWNENKESSTQGLFIAIVSVKELRNNLNALIRHGFVSEKMRGRSDNINIKTDRFPTKLGGHSQAEINKNYKLWTRAFLEKMNTSIGIFPISKKEVIIFLGNQ